MSRVSASYAFWRFQLRALSTRLLEDYLDRSRTTDWFVRVDIQRERIVALVIAFESDTRRLQRAIESGWDDSRPSDVAFWLPEGTKKGDRVLYYVGGKFQYFFGVAKVESNEKTGQTGAWKGYSYWITSKLRTFERPVPGRDVELATTFKVPRRECVVPIHFEKAVWTAARGKPLIIVERAMEGASTEARSRYRNPKLRESALQLAGGRCEGCGKNFAKYAQGLGRHCLVVHHKKQLRDTDQKHETRLSDLAVLCGNCHLLVHANPDKALTIAQLRRHLGR